VILSASVNADVPARYGEWFMRRLEAGYLRVASPDAWQRGKISLDAQNVDGFVFWTRDIGPFISALHAVRLRGFAFTVQYALTADPASPQTSAAARFVHALRGDYGPRVVVWRYDPVVLDDLRTLRWHEARFAQLARLLQGGVDEVVVAFARPVSRVTPHSPLGKGRLVSSARGASMESDPEQRRELVRRFVAVAAESGMRLTLCADAALLVPRSSPARCIDVRRLAQVSGRAIDAATGGFMRDCLCAHAIDIGDYGGRAPEQFCGAIPKRRRRRHDPRSEYLFEPSNTFRPIPPSNLPF
jgi:hypothetical protein